MRRNLADSVFVITGASSGIGRATALAAAREGSSLVLAARRAEALDELARECETRGGRAVAVPTDVSDEEAVLALARKAVATFGRVDVWVNNAAVTLFGRFEETPMDEYRRVVETNLFGYVHGARAALRTFREQGSGTLVNVSSVVGEAAQPYTSSYVLTKHAIRALGMSLRQELMLDGGGDVHVCTVLPPSVDTPLFQHAANHTGRAIQAMRPVYPAERVAQTILSVARRPRAETHVGAMGVLLGAQARHLPRLTERLMARMVERGHFRDAPAPDTEGNLFRPMPGLARVDGGWREGRPVAAPAVVAAAGGALVLGAAWLARRRRLVAA